MEKKKIKNKYIKSLIKKNRVIGIQEICKDPLKVKKLKRNINSRYLIFKKAFLDSKKNKISFNGKPKLMVACSEMHDRSKVSSLFQYRISQDNRNPFYVKLDEKHRQ
mmetsp:Transcript_108630/g.162496  ORF Transcript_108630/g.162496 Transcript_108630/m.162496 type:complete len:107 (+) Transcript_108630:105-425(+)